MAEGTRGASAKAALVQEFQTIDDKPTIRISDERLPNYWLTKLFKFRRAILNLKKCIIKVIMLH